MSRAGHRAALASVFALLGCTAETSAMDEGDASTTDDGPTASSTTGTVTSLGGSGIVDGSDTSADDAAGTTTGSDGGNDAGYEDDGDGDGCSFTCPDPPAPPPSGGVCGLATQNCPEDEKCMPWANDGGSLWNAVRCAAVASNPSGVGEPCTVEGSGVSGLDDCDRGLQCFNVDHETNEGVCAQICGAIDGAPICPQGTSCAIYGAARVCLEPCDPLAHACPLQHGCYPAGTFVGPGEPPPPFFTCERVSGSTEPLLPCEVFQSACESGSVCFDAESLPCLPGYIGCCTELCDLMGADDCPEGLTCTPYLDPAPNALLEGVGVCLET